MKIGFSSQVAPGSDLEALIEFATSSQFDGVELRGLRGELNLPLVPELAADPAAVRARFAEKGVELVCLGASANLSLARAHQAAKQKAFLTEYLELASALGCPFVRILPGDVPRNEGRRDVLSRLVERLLALAPVASRNHVTLLIENGGDFPGSDDMWYLMDALAHPSVRCCWNQCNAMTVRERATNSIPRLGSKIALVHVCDATFSEQGMLREYCSPGEGEVEIARMIDLLRGIAYRGYLVFDWPKLWIPSLPEPSSVLPAAAAFLRECVSAKQSILSAYKGDKNAPRMPMLS